jgi:lactaldehyde dehydrogenase / glycolaldehyde dehydrogenase
LPEGVFNIVYGRGATTGRALTTHEDVRMVSFTGSVETGSKIMADAAKNITKVNLELGGKAPAIVCADADLDLAARTLKAGRVLNTGAACNAPERIYVDRKVADEFCRSSLPRCGPPATATRSARMSSTWGRSSTRHKSPR